MAQGGEIPATVFAVLPREVRRESRRASSTRSPRVHSQPPRGVAGVQGTVRIPGERVHLDQRGDRARHSQGQRVLAGRRHLARRRRAARGLVHGCRGHPARRRSRSGGAAAARRDAAGARRGDRAGACPGNHIGDIGAAIQQSVEAAGFSVVRDLVGHGIGREPHEEPQVPNFGTAGRGAQARAGDGRWRSSPW